MGGKKNKGLDGKSASVHWPPKESSILPLYASLPFTSSLLHEKRKGFYHCVNCDAKLFSSDSKFDSKTGWPSFTTALPGAFKTKVDYSFGMKRIEYHCANCGAHHGHVFDDGPGENGKRFCNNGLCLIFIPDD